MTFDALHIFAAIGAIWFIGFVAFSTFVGVCLFAAPSQESVRLRKLERRAYRFSEHEHAVREWHRAEMRVRRGA